MRLERALAFSVRFLRLSPAEFWRLGAHEFLLLMQALAAPASAPPRASLDALIARYPDKEPGNAPSQ